MFIDGFILVLNLYEKEKNMFCSKCGSTLEEKDGKIICPKCGVLLDKSEKQTAPVLMQHDTQDGNQLSDPEMPSDSAPPRGFSSKKNIIIIILAAILVLGLGIGITAIAVTNSPSFKVSQGIDLAERYLSEQNYEQAIIEYEKVLEIEPMNVDAYLGIAKAYEKSGEIDKAIEILQEGYEKTNDNRIKEMLDSLTNPAQSSESSSSSRPVESSTSSSSSSPESSSSTPASSSSSHNESSSAAGSSSSYSSSSVSISSSSSTPPEPNPVEIRYVTADRSYFELSSYEYNGPIDTIYGYSGYYENMKIPDFVKYILVPGTDNMYYRWCSKESGDKLKNLMLPDNLVEIDTFALDSFPNLESINISEKNKNYATVDGVLYNKDKTKLIYCPAGKKGFCSIPDSVTSVEPFSFNYCKYLTGIKISKKMTKIESGMFYFCNSLTSVIIPDNIKEIGSSAFSHCTSLKTITIPSGVTIIEDEAFSCCTKLTEINVSVGNKNYCSIDGVLFTKDKTKIISYPAGKNDKSYSIPNGVKEIDGAFSGCINLVNVSIPNSVSKIGWNTFEDCQNLSKVILPDSIKDIKPNAFYNCKNLKNISLPNGVILHASYGIDESYNPFDGCENIKFTYNGKTYNSFDELPTEIVVWE